MEAIRKELKLWEREFVRVQGRRPTKADIRGNAIEIKYKEYREGRIKSETPPQPPKPPSQPSQPPEESPEAEPPEPDQTPRKAKPTVVYPTPQHNGRVLGLFDIRLPPQPQPATPSRAQQTNPITTPRRQTNPEPITPQHPNTNPLPTTPASHQTPSYVRQGLYQMDDSPLIPSKPFKTMSQLIKESKEAFAEPLEEIEPMIIPEEPEPEPEPEPAQKRKLVRTSRAKKKYRPVPMKPVLETDVVSTKKATHNYRRLNIQKKRPFKR